MLHWNLTFSERHEILRERFVPVSPHCMRFKPSEELTETEVQKGLRLVIGDGLTTEAMTTLTGGAFIVAFSLLMGASNFQIGLLSSLPTFTNVFQILSIWLVRKYSNRKLVTVMGSLLARVPLIVIGALPFIFPEGGTIQLLLFFLFFYYLFGSVAGPSWNAWMKDLVPESRLGAYFSKRSRYAQILNVVLSIVLAFFVDFVRKYYPGYEMTLYGTMFILAGIVGIGGALILSKVHEPRTRLARGNILQMLRKPLDDYNFRQLLFFNSAWLFALNLATPFFMVFLMKSMGLSISYIIPLTILSQLSSIFTVRAWGIFADRYSNKTVLAIGTPLYFLCIIAWCFVGIYTSLWANLTLLAIIYLISGVSTAGINLALTNIGLKLAPRNEAIIYLSAKNIITSVFSSLAPLLGGYLADYFTLRQLRVMAEWTGPSLQKSFRLLLLHEWNFLFLIGAVLALLAIQLLPRINEAGEVDRGIVVRVMRSSLRNNLKDHFLVGSLFTWQSRIASLLTPLAGRKVRTPNERKADE
jgi:MFS family permease